MHKLHTESIKIVWLPVFVSSCSLVRPVIIVSHDSVHLSLTTETMQKIRHSIIEKDSERFIYIRVLLIQESYSSIYLGKEV